LAEEWEGGESMTSDMSNADKSKVKQGVNFGNDLTIFISPARSE
jgi:hypothetical protein